MVARQVTAPLSEVLVVTRVRQHRVELRVAIVCRVVSAPWQLKQARCERSLGGDGNKGRPPAGERGSGGPAEGGWNLAGLCLGQAPQEGDGFVSPPAPGFDAADDESASSGGRKLRVSDLPFAARSVCDCRAGPTVGDMAHFPSSPQRAHERRIQGQLGAVMEGEPLCEDFDLPAVVRGHFQVHVLEWHVGADRGPGFSADARPGALQGYGAWPQESAGGASCPVVPKKV
eukprot:s66_g5.t1